ncbi:MAG: hypothetical protein ACXAC8_19875 [Candidatus Hodarchaeales archaeon]|jgi:hypothetical protein
MAWVLEKVDEFKVMLYSQTPSGKIRLSKHKSLVLIFYVGAFAFTFLHFANIPPDVINDLQIAAAAGETITIPSSPRLGIALIFYLYISFIAFISIFKGGSIPNFLSRPRLPSARNRYKVLFIVTFFLFSGLVITLIFLSIYFSGLIIILTGPMLYVIWTVLEPYFLLSGILAIIRVIDADYSLEGFSLRGKRSLVVIFFLGYLTPIVFLIFLALTSTGTEFSEITLIGQTFSFYQPAMASFSRTFTSVLSLTLLFLVIWWVKDRFGEQSLIREKKKGMLPLFLGFTLVFIIITVVPLIATTSGSLQEITSIIDIIGLFIAVIMGLWNTLGVEQIIGPIHGIRRLNPLEYITRMHPYTKALFLLIISIFAFYSSVESSTIAAITGNPDTLKLQKLNLLAAFIGTAFMIILWRYKGQPRSTTPGLLRTTRKQFEEGLSKIRSVIGGETISSQIVVFEEEE